MCARVRKRQHENNEKEKAESFRTHNTNRKKNGFRSKQLDRELVQFKCVLGHTAYIYEMVEPKSVHICDTCVYHHPLIHNIYQLSLSCERNRQYQWNDYYSAIFFALSPIQTSHIKCACALEYQLCMYSINTNLNWMRKKRFSFLQKKRRFFTIIMKTRAESREKKSKLEEMPKWLAHCTYTPSAPIHVFIENCVYT